MTLALPDAELRGSDEPRVMVWPDGMVASSGVEMVDWARQVGMFPLRWQEIALELTGAERSGGRWAASEIAIGAPRQNGKGLIYEVRGLAGLFLFGERRILYSAHRLDTAEEFFSRVKDTIDNHDDLRKRVKSIRAQNGKVQIETMNGSMLKIMSRMAGAGRGMSPEVLLLDEFQIMSPEAMRTLLPAQSAKGSKIQRIMMGTPPEPDKVLLGESFRRRRDRGRAGDGKRFGYAEWSVGDEWPADAQLQRDLVSDRAGWARANPALGPEDDDYLILTETVEDELAAFGDDLAGFARERLWLWPSGGGGGVFSVAEWNTLYDAFSKPTSHKVIGLDMGPSREWVRVGIASVDGADSERVHVEHLGDFRPAQLRRQLADRLPVHNPTIVAVDAASPIAAYKQVIAGICEQLGIEFRVTTTTEHVEACGLVYDAIKGPDADTAPDDWAPTDSNGAPARLRLAHIGQEELERAFTSVTLRKLGQRFAFASASGVDISPAVAVTIAARELINAPRRRSAYEDGGVMSV